MKTNDTFLEMAKRRRELKMSYAVLAKKSKLSMPTVVRTLSGKNPRVSFDGLCAIAETLGMKLIVTPTVPAEELLEHQANVKARALVGLVQGTSGLEAQAVNDEAIERMKRQTVHELLAGSRRTLWSE